MASKVDVLKAAAERARAAGFNGRGFALVPYMTDEEREVYYAAERESASLRRSDPERHVGYYHDAVDHFGGPARAMFQCDTPGGITTWIRG